MGFGLGLVLLVTGTILVARIPEKLLGIDARTIGIILLALGVATLALSVRFRSSFGAPLRVGRRRGD
jgi:ABC-type transport system involved in cytochrome c biogenesis permease component